MITFHAEDIVFSPPQPLKLSQWISSTVIKEGYLVGDISFIYCSRDYMLNLNKSYLNHHDHTDVITFDLGDGSTTISADIFIGVDQVRDNAFLYEVSFHQELKRVMVHGILHLLGYGDKTPQEQEEMRKKEEAYLSL